MNFERLIVILPCQTLEGYWLDRQVENADELLSAWSALYHPALVAQTRALPSWVSAEKPPEDPAGSLVVLPQSTEEVVAPDWLDQAAGRGACLIRGSGNRDQTVHAALERLERRPGTVDPELAADFLALGFCHLQMEVLIRDAGSDMGYDAQYYDEQYYDYGQQFDRELFQKETVAAAEAAVQGDLQSAQDQLRAAFTRLTEARRGLPYTYSANQDPHLLGLTLVAPTTLGRSLRDQLAGKVPTNLLLSGRLVEQMGQREPATLAALKEALSNDRVAIIGGEFDELPIPLLAPEVIFGHLRRGLDAYRRHLGQPPTVFGRRRFGLSPVLPQILRKCGFTGVLHFTLDDGRFPTSSRSRAWWVGVDGTELEALAQLPLDADRSGSFLNFASKISNTGYQETNATVVLAHWPGRSSPWYRDLQRAAAYSPVLGEFRKITEYLEESQSTSERIRSGPDEYRSPYLKQAVAQRQPDPISRWTAYYRRRTAADALHTLRAMADVVGGPEGRPANDDDLLRQIEDAERTESGARGDLDDRLHRRLKDAAGRFFGLLPRRKTAASKGCLFANPWSFPRRALVDVSQLDALPAVEAPVRAAGESAGRKQIVVDVPPMGFTWVGPEQGSSRSLQEANHGKSKRRRRKKQEEAPMVAENVLRNEHFEVTIDPTTGAVQAIHDYVSRGNRLAQQIALRLPRPKASRQEGWAEEDLEQDYTVMRADKISATSAGPVVGQIVSRGRLLTRDGQRVARFVQTTQAWRGSPVLRLKIELDIQREPDPDPWNSYYAARFAWGDAAADVYRSVSLANAPAEHPQVEAPHFVDIRSGQRRVTILTGGLPYHRRFGVRKMDTLLVVHGETARSFDLGIGINLTHPVPAALDFLAPEHVQMEEAPPPANRSGWLFHVDAKNVIATHWEPLYGEGEKGVGNVLGEAPAGPFLKKVPDTFSRLAGFRVRLLETEGRRCQAGLQSFRPVSSARKVTLQNEQLRELPVEDDKITIDLGAHEWVQVEAEFGG